MRHKIRVGDEYARRERLRFQHGNRLSRLDEKGLIILKPVQGLDDFVKAFPVARRLASTAIDNQFRRLLGDLRIKIVHQHPLRRFLNPSTRGSAVAARRANRRFVLIHRGPS